ncbi:hypothetical protein ACFFLM_09565 [Deinococcus oregonensis]|uniref:Uncharacterized protein n=1 Tax=Deinococcus oregonensis TaxID=1805970 RepID=A0ABV6AXG7_9DEIO
MSARPEKQPLNPAGFLATQDLKERGWTAALIAKFLGTHDATRPNGLKMGRRKLPPVKLYTEARVEEAERDENFLIGQARAADARERAEKARAARNQARAALLEAAASSYRPTIHPEPLRKGAVKKAREPYLPKLEELQARLEGEIGKVSAQESATLAALLRARLDAALAAAYDWYPDPAAKKKEVQATSEKAKPGNAKASDWRKWDWD